MTDPVPTDAPDEPPLVPAFDVPSLEAELAECEAYLLRVQDVRDRAIRLRGQLDVLTTLPGYTPGPTDSPTTDHEVTP